MKKNLGRTHIRLIVLVSIILSLLVFIIPACKKEPQEQPRVQNPQSGASKAQQPGMTSMKDRISQGANQAAQTGKEAPLRLDDIISSEKSWSPTLSTFAGKAMPDFTVKDLTGQEHKLSGLRGKNVMVVIWAPWCGPCKMEIPDLVELRKTLPQEHLTILAISYLSPQNTEEMVRQFVQQNSTINYPVAVVGSESMPSPLNSVEYIPSTVFIGPDGTIKITTMGVVPFADMMAILKSSGWKATKS